MKEKCSFFVMNCVLIKYLCHNIIDNLWYVLIIMLCYVSVFQWNSWVPKTK